MEIRKLLEEFSEEIIKDFVQKNSDYYLAKWRLLSSKNSKISWNWSAFLFGVMWLGYRKMYLYSFIFVLLTIFTIIPILGLFISLALWIGLGMVGNYLYGKFTYNKLTELKIAFPEESKFKEEVLKAGGTSVLGSFIALFIAIFVWIIITLIINSLAMHQPYSYTNF